MRSIVGRVLEQSIQHGSNGTPLHRGEVVTQVLWFILECAVG